MTGVYFHIPFCIRKCFYCAFDSAPVSQWNESVIEDYLEAVLREMRLRRSSISRSGVDTVFFGGGTPSVLSPQAINKTLDALNSFSHISCGAEISLEANPSSLKSGLFKEFRKAGINRVSIGGQTFDDNLLKVLGRLHSSFDLEISIRSALEAGFNAVGLDLIFGFPGHSLQVLASDLLKAVELGAEHLSLYMFYPEPFTSMGDACLSGDLLCPSDEELADMFNFAHDFLSEKGYRHYEISNFALNGRVCLHNMNYWSYGEYVGFGSSACSFISKSRIKNVASPFRYIGLLKKNVTPGIFLENLSLKRKMGEYAMLALRTDEGVNDEYFYGIFGRRFSEIFSVALKKLTSLGLIERRGERFIVPYKYFPIQSEIAEEFL